MKCNMQIILKYGVVADTTWMQIDLLLDMQNVWLCSEKYFDAVSSLRDPWHSKTSNLLCYLNLQNYDPITKKINA